MEIYYNAFLSFQIEKPNFIRDMDFAATIFYSTYSDISSAIIPENVALSTKNYLPIRLPLMEMGPKI